MLTVKQMDHVNMGVSNLEESVRFYQDLFGFEVKETGTWQGLPWKIIGKAGVAFLALYEKGKPRSPEQDVQLRHFGLHIEEFDQAEKKLRDYGVTIQYGGAVWQGQSRSLYIEDPSGYVIELSEKFGGGL